jgi:hypothetical protein
MCLPATRLLVMQFWKIPKKAGHYEPSGAIQALDRHVASLLAMTFMDALLVMTFYALIAMTFYALIA